MPNKINFNVCNTAKVTSVSMAAFQLGLLLFGFLLISRYSYPLYHGLAETFTAIIACTIFAIAWNSRRFIDNNYLLIIGVSMIFVATIDTLHAFAYKGVNIIPGSTTNMATQLWVAGRFVSSFSFLLSLYFLRKKVNPKTLFFSYFVVTLLLIVSIVHWKTFPACYIEGQGLTNFKIFSEYLIIAIYTSVVGLLYLKRDLFEKRFLQLLILAISLMITSELFFTAYLSPFDFSNSAGHLFKIATYYFLYLGLLENGLMKPYRVLFKKLKDHEVFLSESEERYRLLIENSTLAILLQVNKKITFANQAAKKMFDAKPGEMVNRSILDFTPDSNKIFLEKQLATLEANMVHASTIESKIITTDGRLLDTEITSNPITIKGQPTILTVLTDITKRKQLERQTNIYTEKIEEYAADMRKFMLAVEGASEAIYMTDKNFKITYANRETEKLTGYYRSEIIGKTPFDWRLCKSNEKTTDFQEAIIEKLLNKKPLTEEVLSCHRNKNEYIAQLEISPVLDKDQNTNFFVFIERNISRRKEIDQAKNEFVSLASHQLRTPLSSITLVSELFLKNVYGELNEKQTERMYEIYNSCTKMKELINELLNISRIELGTFAVKIENILFSDYLEENLKNYELLAREKNITLSKNFDNFTQLKLPLDVNILGIVLDNLLSNAIRYTQDGGKIEVGYEKRSQDLMLWVKDSGCGIPINQQSKVFDKLFRANNAQAISADGSGLGLYMTKSVLKKIQGSIWVESIENQGSTFFVRLPIT